MFTFLGAFAYIIGGILYHYDLNSLGLLIIGFGMLCHIRFWALFVLGFLGGSYLTKS